jgi:hypothetical protein
MDDPPGGKQDLRGRRETLQYVERISNYGPIAKHKLKTVWFISLDLSIQRKNPDLRIIVKLLKSQFPLGP